MIAVAGYEKAWVAGVGATATALVAFLSAVQVATGDSSISLEDVTALLSALVTCVATVWGVWRVPNTDKNRQDGVSPVTLDDN